jgi:DNA-binding NarL/FixJ family response regulator
MADPIRLLVCDDHALFREGLQALFAATPDVESVGEASSGERAIAQADSLQPDVILMDINMPGLDGVAATRKIIRSHPAIGIIMVTMLEDDSSVFSAMRAGARGYVLKGARHEELLQTIRAVASGQALFGPAIAARMMKFFEKLATGFIAPVPEGAFPELTPREREVLTLIAKGSPNAQIAEQLVISYKTVRNHITSIFSKLRVADRAAAILLVRDAGLGTKDQD